MRSTLRDIWLLIPDPFFEASITAHGSRDAQESRLIRRAYCNCLDGKTASTGKHVLQTFLCAMVACVNVVCLAQTGEPLPEADRTTITQAFRPEGMEPYVPGHWGDVGVDLKNPTDVPIDVLSVMQFKGDSSLQYARRVWVPARSMRSTWFPLLLPKNNANGATRVEIETLLFSGTGPEEKLIPDVSGRRLGTGILPILDESPVIGEISDQNDDAPLDAVTAMRLDRGLTRRIARLTINQPSPNRECLEGFDQLVLTTDRLASDDAAGLTAVRRWLESGGRLWIMLDEVSPPTVELLLGEAFRGHVVDRVGVTEFTMRGVPGSGAKLEGTTYNLDEPADFVRVLIPDAQVIHTIDGWPASFLLPIGKGTVLVTTLASRGWLRPRGDNDPEPAHPNRYAPLLATDRLHELSFLFAGPRARPVIAPQEFEDYLTEQIGYQVVDRRSVMLVLGGFWAMLIGAAAWLTLRNRMEHLGWMGPSAAVASALILAMLGHKSRSVVPATVAVAQLVEVTTGSRELSTTGLVAMYNPTASTQSLGAEQGGIFVPNSSAGDGTIRRLVWTDMDKWNYERLQLAAGVHFAPFSYARHIEEPISAQARFGPEGPKGTIMPGPFRDLSDAVIVMPTQERFAARLRSDGGFTVGPSDRLAAAEFFGERVVSDEQRRRRDVYRRLLNQRGQGKHPTQPTLLAWASPVDQQFSLLPEARQSGSALLAIPLAFDRPEPGTRVLIPAGFASFEPVESSGAYDVNTGEWIQSTVPRKTVLRFQVPPSVLPLKLQRAKLTVSINAPTRTMVITAEGDGKSRPLQTYDSPIGTIELDIEPNVLALDDTGGIAVGVDVGNAAAGAVDGAGIKVNSSEWQIRDVELELSGETVSL